jgi:RNA polymerase sigma factor for flagellar operon FliA
MAVSTAERTDAVNGLWKRYLRGRRDEDRNSLVEHYRHLAEQQAARLAKRLPAQVMYDELVSAGFDGLIEAVQAYDPDRKAKFETFCQQRVIGAIMDWLRSLDIQSRTVRRFEKKMIQVREILDSELGRPPSDKELAERLGMSPERFQQLARLSQLGHEVHFSSIPQETEGSASGRHLWETSDPRVIDPATQIRRQMLVDHITKGLAREERLVIILYYFEEMTMAEIGATLNLSESRVSQIHKDVILRLRGRLKDRFEDLVSA